MSNSNYYSLKNSSVLNPPPDAATTVDFSDSSNVYLGSVSNIHILNGSNGYVLSTNGSGNLSWVQQTINNGDGGNASSSVLVLASLTGGNAISA